jgi:hypothetical protein
MTDAELLTAARRITAAHPGVVITYDRNGWSMDFDPDWQITAPMAGGLLRPPSDHRWGDDILAPCGTHASFNRHKARSEEPCPDCWDAERDYQRAAKRRSRRRLRAAS